MRTSIWSLSLLLPMLVAAPAFGGLELPRPSPAAKVSQRIGLTDVEVDYSSPGVKGRKIWGKLVPYDKLWRTGANSATKITFSEDVKVAGKDVPAGTYAIFTIPGRRTWTVIINKNADQSGTRKYDQGLDQLRFTMKPKVIPFRERLTFIFADYTDDAASLNIEWEKLRIQIPIQADTAAHASANIEKASKEAWRSLANAARYMLDEKKDTKKALRFIDQSLSLHDDWYNNWIKAALLAQAGDYKGAYPLAKKAKELGDKAEFFFWKDRVERALNDWKSKI